MERVDWKIGKDNNGVWFCIPTTMEHNLVRFEEHCRLYSKSHKKAQEVLIALMD